MKHIAIFLLLMTSACTTSYYQPVAGKDVAYVSFSNMSREIPDISIITNCKRTKIDPELIKYRKPSEHTDLLLEIPSNQPVSFGYDYVWFEGEKIQFVTTGSALPSTRPNQLSRRMHEKKVKTCAEKITFIPEPNRKYEVYFGKNARSCVIGVSEALLKPTNHKKHLMKVKSVSPPEC